MTESTDVFLHEPFVSHVMNNSNDNLISTDTKLGELYFKYFKG
jgi:hypothetical protein